MTEDAIVWLDRAIDRAFADSISDIHLEFEKDDPHELKVRVRRSGDLTAWEPLFGTRAKGVIARIKSVASVGSGLITKSEEGRYTHRYGAGNLDPNLSPDEYDKRVGTLPRKDLRLVVLPTIRGEKHVLRLPSIAETPKITELGLSNHNLKRLATILGWANGLVLFAGPVGAGKTTSMYSVLEYLGGPQKAVYSVEDPVERTLENVDQMEVNDRAQNSFATMLKSLRRSDLQVLMIGEIRDQETAYSAIQISIAGARVVSSIHANDSVAAIEAMVALSKADPQQIMQSLRGVVSQRLIKKIHEVCGGTGSVDDVQCEDCSGTGVSGRVAVHEVLIITQEFADAVSQGAPRSKLEEIAKADGMITLRQDTGRRLRAKETTPKWISEVLGSEELKATKPPATESPLV